MPATRIVILESTRTLEQRIRAAAHGLPLEIRAARTSDELADRLVGCPFGIVLVEVGNAIEKCLAEVEVARRLTDAVLVYVRKPLIESQSAALRLAGAAGILHGMASVDVWRQTLRAWSNRTQERFAISDPAT